MAARKLSTILFERYQQDLRVRDYSPRLSHLGLVVVVLAASPGWVSSLRE